MNSGERTELTQMLECHKGHWRLQFDKVGFELIFGQCSLAIKIVPYWDGHSQ